MITYLQWKQLTWIKSLPKMIFGDSIVVVGVVVDVASTVAAIGDIAAAFEQRCWSARKAAAIDQDRHLHRHRRSKYQTSPRTREMQRALCQSLMESGC